MTMTTLKKTALNSLHHELGAKCTSFANHELPIWFSSIKDEHLAVRKDAGMFDIAHMGVFAITGSNSDAFLQRLSCNSVVKARSETMIYSMFLNDQGMILDDVMFGCLDKTWYLVVNGANKEKISAWMQDHMMDNVTIRDCSDSQTLIAVQGPAAVSKLTHVLGSDLHTIKRFGMRLVSWKGSNVLATRTGYTGEDGFELLVANKNIPLLWQALLDAGVSPCGLAARDTLRIEAGLPLYGQELSESIHPLMTRYPWVIKWDHDFIGKTSLSALKTSSFQKAVGLELSEKLIARPNYTIQEGGAITSGTLVPLTQKSIALAFVDPAFADLGSQVHVMIRNKLVPATVVTVPFT
tara:strand:+ start:381 stop:1436 length:1056 start_codon:yes stop_codon:yes gene_type:complete